ncbi:MAG: hypothetical protein NT031_13350 [Planctomycetota bacterium]|nr:hypothetical protein [Planctomycetota bacterium]
MNDRERFLTLDRWAREGMPDNVLHPAGPESWPTQESLGGYFGFDLSSGVYFRETAGVNMGFIPPFEHKVLSEENGVVTQQDGEGVVFRWSHGGHSTRQFVRFPVQSQADFREITKRLDPSSPARVPEGWEKRPLAIQAAGAPICIQAGGYYGFARSLMGMENLSTAFFDQPELIEEIFEYRTAYVSAMLERVLALVKPDFAEFWEDMAFKTGPLVSPTLYRKLALKHYQAITALLRRHGVELILLDSDGNIDELIPIWLDGGINAIWPFEIAAGMDPLAVRAKYGKSLALIGGIDKRAMAAGRAAIDREVYPKVPRLIESGGFIPTCDHAVPPDVSLGDYEYYLGLIHKIAQGR